MSPSPGRAARLPLLLVALLLAAACGTTRSVRPLGKGNAEVDLALGGPLVHLFGTILPLPFAHLGVGYGLGEQTDVFARTNLFPLSMRLADLDVGLARQLVRPAGWVPSLSVNGDVLMVAGAAGLTTVPNGTLVASWEPLPRTLGYVGTTHAFTWDSRLDGTQGFGAHWAPFVGARYDFWSVPLSLTAELKWFAPLTDSAHLTVDYIGIANHGTVSPTLGVAYRFGGGAP